MNEKDDVACRDAWTKYTGSKAWPKSIEFTAGFAAALEYARGKQEPVAVISAACAIEPTIHGAITLKPGDKLYTHPAPAVAVNEQLLEALKHLYHNAKKSGANMGLALDVAEDAIAAAEAQMKEQTK